MNACKTCKAEIRWAMTPAGKAAPIDRLAVESGNVLLLQPTGLGKLLAITLTGAALEEARKQHVPLRLNHWATCPDREQWKEGTAGG